MKAQTELLALNRSSLYYKLVQASPEELVLKHRIEEIYTEHPFYGSRRIAAALRRDGHALRRKAVQHNMQEMGLAGICPGPNLSRCSLQHHVYPISYAG